MKNNEEHLGVTAAEFAAYRRVQKRGRFNMIMEASAAMRSAKLDSGTYWFIINNFSALKRFFEGGK